MNLIDGPIDPLVRILWRPTRNFVVWHPVGNRGLYVSWRTFLLVVGPPAEHPSVRCTPDRLRVAAGFVSLTWWRVDA